MKASHRSALLTAGVAATLAVSAVPSVASAQRQAPQPGPDTKRVLVTTFRGDPEGGLRAADEIRNRIQGEYNIKTLLPNSKKDIDNTLTSSGYKPDSALSANDIKELSKLLRADEIIDGNVARNGTNWRVTTRLFLPRDAALSQPLGTFESNDLGNIAKQVVDEYDKARRQIPDNQACENGIRANTPQVAVAAARKGIASYPKATLLRLCLASAYAAMKTTADSTGPWKDSVIAVTKEILALDPSSRIAYQLAYDAYKSKADTTDALTSLVGLMNADPTNTTLREQVIAELINSGRPEIAVPTAKQLVTENPGDPSFAKTYWLVLRAAKRYKESVPAGVALVTIDSAQADSSYFLRQIQDLSADSSYAKAAEFASAGAAKFPRSTTFLIFKAQNERKAGQLQAAKATLERVLQLDPKAQLVNVQLATIVNDMGSPEDALKYLRADIAADPTSKDRDAGVALSFGNKLYQSAVASKKIEDFRRALPVLMAADSMSSTVNSKFLIAVTAFQELASSTDALRASHSCEDFKHASELLVLVNTLMPQAGSVSPDAAKQILGGAAQFAPFVEGSMKRYCH